MKKVMTRAGIVEQVYEKLGLSKREYVLRTLVYHYYRFFTVT